MSDLFKRTELQWGGAMAADKGLLTANKGLSGILMQNLQLTYAQNVTRIYEIGEAGQKIHIYYIGGRSQGNLAAGHVIGPKVTMALFYDNFGDVCQAETNDIELKVQAQCDGAASAQVGYKAKFCVLTQVGLSVASQDFVINENSALMFSNLEYTENNNALAVNLGLAGLAGLGF